MCLKKHIHFFLLVNRRRDGTFIATPCLVRLIAHHLHKLSTILDVIVTEPRLVPFLTIESGRLDILVILRSTDSFDFEYLSVAQSYLSIGKERTTDVVRRRTRCNPNEENTTNEVIPPPSSSPGTPIKSLRNQVFSI